MAVVLKINRSKPKQNVSKQYTVVVFDSWMNQCLNQSEWFNDSHINIVTCFGSEWISVLNESIEQWLTHKDSHLFNSSLNMNEFEYI